LLANEVKENERAHLYFCISEKKNSSARRVYDVFSQKQMISVKKRDFVSLIWKLQISIAKSAIFCSLLGSYFLFQNKRFFCRLFGNIN